MRDPTSEVAGKAGREHPAQSFDAADNVAPNAASQRLRILQLVKPKYPDGMTNRELSQQLGIAPNQIATRTLELREDGWLEILTDESGNEVKRETTPGNHGWVQRYVRGQMSLVPTGHRPRRSKTPRDEDAMTDTIPLSDITGTEDKTRRDQYGRYYIVPPDGSKPVGYTRVTTVAKALDGGGGLAPWKAAMAVQGLILRKGLFAQWEALMAAHNGDPWYAGEASKAECKRLVEECAAVGGANDRRDQGSALHAITALLDVGRTPTNLSDETQRDLDAYHTGLAEAGITIDGHDVGHPAVELTVVLDKWQVAGTLDRIVKVPHFELPLIADLKTGASLEYSWQSIAVQLAAYSRADSLYQQGPDPSGNADVRSSLPAVDQRWGLIFWLPAGKAELSIIAVDLDAGWEAFEQSMWTRQWRNRHVNIDLSELMTDAGAVPDSQLPPDLTDLLSRSVEANETKIMAAFPGTTVESVEPTPEIRAWLQERINVVVKTPGARQTLTRRWPVDLPKPRPSQAYTGEQLAAIEGLLDDVEAAHKLSFPPERPGAKPEEPSNVRDLFNPTNQEKT